MSEPSVQDGMLGATNKDYSEKENAMEMTPVASSLLKSVGYNDEKEELHVEFLKGGEYLYRGVTWPVFEAMLEAQSVGSFFLRNVKGQYDVVKVVSHG